VPAPWQRAGEKEDIQIYAGGHPGSWGDAEEEAMAEAKNSENRPVKGCAVEGRNVRAVYCRCPECRDEIEIFTDENEITCPKCGKEVTLEACMRNAI